ncbi:hypothetical protein HPP92_027858 [Vanilla planifolia]|uniref:Uncharacterized protein n=1 Tax=Vanilla planifolia TaxID=51239 RepID=A0A835PBK5_VANPL|nr:hypothetical protein HPP92_027858 [Vanilla planifolia]KAG0448503.1 hypothetical protein HPP92_027813 [Vanilla planifolia]
MESSFSLCIKRKRPKHGHHFKARAMNVLHSDAADVVDVLETTEQGFRSDDQRTYMLNVDCDMFANNPKVILHGMCLLLGFEDESSSGYKAPQRFYGGF